MTKLEASKKAFSNAKEGVQSVMDKAHNSLDLQKKLRKHNLGY